MVDQYVREKRVNSHKEQEIGLKTFLYLSSAVELSMR